MVLIGSLCLISLLGVYLCLISLLGITSVSRVLVRLLCLIFLTQRQFHGYWWDSCVSSFSLNVSFTGTGGLLCHPSHSTSVSRVLVGLLCLILLTQRQFHGTGGTIVSHPSHSTSVSRVLVGLLCLILLTQRQFHGTGGTLVSHPSHSTSVSRVLVGLLCLILLTQRQLHGYWRDSCVLSFSLNVSFTLSDTVTEHCLVSLLTVYST